MAKIKCKRCGETIEGDKKGTYISCFCGKCAIDETEYYYRIIGNFDDYEIIEPKEEKKDIMREKLTNDKAYQKVFNYFGYENQRRKLTEEVQELNDAILLYEKGIGDIKDVIEELGDIYNVISGFVIEYDIGIEELETTMRNKMNRTLKRIDSGYYGSRKSN